MEHFVQLVIRIERRGGGQFIPCAGRVFAEDEVEAAVASTLDFWLTLGTEGESFQKELRSFLGIHHSS